MALKSIEKLRNALKDCTSKAGVEPNEFDTYWITASACDMLIDGIEAEIAERYMLLPVDADGEPIHVGDELENNYVVDYVSSHWVLAIGRGAKHTGSCHHVKQRTLENIVADAIQYGHNGITGDRIEGKVAEFCAEIRELLGGDAE